MAQIIVIAGGEGDRVNYTLDADGEPVQIADGDDAADYVIGDNGQAIVRYNYW